MKIILAVLSPLLVLFIGNSQSTKEHVDGLFDKAYATLDDHPDSSYYYAELALDFAEKKDLEWHQANAKFIQGYVYEQKHQFSKAILLYLEAVNVLEELSDERSKKDHAKILINCGNILRDHYKFHDALELYDQALEITDKYDFSTRKVKIHFNKSITYEMMGEYNLSIDQAVSCYELSVMNEDERMMIKAWNRLGLIHQINGHLEESVDYYLHIINHSFKSTNGALHKARAFHNLANIYVEKNENVLVEKNFRSAEKLFIENLYNTGLYVTYKDLNSYYLSQSKFDKATEAGSLALKLYNQMPLELDNYKLFKNLSELNYQTGNYELAKQYMEKYHSENVAFIAQRNFIAQQSDKFKIEVVLAGYYDQIKSRERVAQLTNWLIVVLVISLVIVGLGYWRWKWIKRQLEVELRAHFKEIADIFSPNTLQE